jgi:uncharacterized protein (DUF1330 family)
MPIQSNIDKFKELKRNPNNEPFVMLNLLKFKSNGGAEKYARYVKESNPYVEEVGGKMVFLGKPVELLNGSEDWDLVMLVQYPSRANFLKMANNPGYIEIHKIREEALDRAVLYSMDPLKYKDLLQIK